MCSKLFPSCFLGLESCVHFHPANIYKYTSKHLKPARRICELMESVNPGCELTNASGWPAFGTFRMVYSSMCFPSFVVLFSAVTTAGSEGLLFLRTKMELFILKRGNTGPASRIYLLRQGTVPSGSPSPPGLLHSLAFPVQPRWPLEFVIPGSEAATAPELVAGQGVLSEGRQEQPGIWLL